VRKNQTNQKTNQKNSTMATESDKLHELIDRLEAIRNNQETVTPEEPEIKEATTASRQDLENSLNHLYNILITIHHDDQSDVFQSEAEELMAEELIGTIAEFKARIEGDIGSFSEEKLWGNSKKILKTD